MKTVFCNPTRKFLTCAILLTRMRKRGILLPVRLLRKQRIHHSRFWTLWHLLLTD